MNGKIKSPGIAIISATNRKSARSFQLAELYQSILERMDISSEIIDLEKLPNDFIFSALYDNKRLNPEFNALQDRIREVEKCVFIVPEYNGSFPGVLKAFIDGMDYPSAFRNKKAALIGHSSGNQGSALALSHLTDILNYLGMHVFARKLRFPMIEENLNEKGLLSESYSALLEEQARDFIQF